MKKNVVLALIAIVMLGGTVKAQPPVGYYNAVNGLYQEDLKAALNIIIRDHTEFDYTDSSTDVWDILKESDRDPNNSDNVILIYTGWSVNGAQEYNSGSGWSREHVWAKSHGDFDTDPPAGSDAHHLRPADISVNSARGNKDFDNGGSPHHEATECNTDSDSWEPRDAVKGDVARMMFYMATRYEGNNGEPDLELVDYTPTEGPLFGKLSTLLEWHIQDPVDDFERNRNEVVYSYQGNRNPFIDHPEFVNRIWGEDPTVIGDNFEISVSVYPNPASEYVNIAIPNNIGNSNQIAIVDVFGKTIYSEFTEKRMIKIQSSEFASGLYSVQISNNHAGVFITKKLVIEK